MYCLVVGLTLLSSVEFIFWWLNGYCHRLKYIMLVKAFSSIRWQLTPICNVGRRQSLSKAWQDFQARSRRGNNLQGQNYIVIQVVHHPKQISLFAQRMLILPTKIFAELWPWWSLGGQFSTMPSMRPSTSTIMCHIGLQASRGVIKNIFSDLIPPPGARWMPPPGKDISWQWIKDALPSLKQHSLTHFTVLIIIIIKSGNVEEFTPLVL